MDRLQERVLEHIDEEMLIDLAKDMTSIRSVTPEEWELAEFLDKRLGELGFKPELQEVPVYEGRPNVIAILEGDKDYRSLMLNGHIDDYPPGPGWTRDPFKAEVIDGRLYGFQHIKGSIAAMIMAACAIREAEIKPRGDIILTFVMGETDTYGAGTIEACKRYHADAGICGEPSGSHYINTAHAGNTQFQITTEGAYGHSRALTRINAIRKMCKLISNVDASILTYKECEFLKDLPTLTIGKISGGLHPAFAAPNCTITVDVRSVPGMTQESIKKDVENLIDRLSAEDPELKATVEMWGPPKFHPRGHYEISHNEPIVQCLRKAHKDLTGEEPGIGSDVRIRFAIQDARWMVDAGIPTPVYGPDSPAVPADKYMEVDEIITACKVITLAALDFCTKKK